MFGSGVGSIHQDVLSANPIELEEKRQLVVEIKNRAKGSISSRNFPEGIELYTKALEVISDSDNVEKAILYSNRSMCYHGMNKFVEAEADAQQSIEFNSLYTKAYFRRTAALIGLKRFQDAKSCVLIGLKQLPGDKDLNAQLTKINAELQSSGASSTPEAVSSTSSKSSPKSSTKSSSAAASSTKKSTKSDDKDDAMDVDDDEEDEKQAAKDIVRGYKKLPDGRVTTFFNNNLDDTVGAIATLHLIVSVTNLLYCVQYCHNVSTYFYSQPYYYTRMTVGMFYRPRH